MKIEKISVQEYISLGYIFLVLLGIATDVIYYKYLNIDILTHSTILDVLISPVNILVNDVKVLGMFTTLIVVAHYTFNYLFPSLHLRFRDKPWYKKMVNIERQVVCTSKGKQRYFSNCLNSDVNVFKVWIRPWIKNAKAP
jgi:hypothetical protein